MVQQRICESSFDRDNSLVKIILGIHVKENCVNCSVALVTCPRTSWRLKSLKPR